jgi:hypothetical protein
MTSLSFVVPVVRPRAPAPPHTLTSVVLRDDSSRSTLLRSVTILRRQLVQAQRQITLPPVPVPPSPAPSSSHTSSPYTPVAQLFATAILRFCSLEVHARGRVDVRSPIPELVGSRFNYSRNSSSVEFIPGPGLPRQVLTLSLPDHPPYSGYIVLV